MFCSKIYFDVFEVLFSNKGALQTEFSRAVYGPDFPDTYSIIRNYDLTFINSNEIIETPRTISHKVRYIGGIGLKPSKLLTEVRAHLIYLSELQEFEKILDSSSNGVVIFSFGTQVRKFGKVILFRCPVIGSTNE